MSDANEIYDEWLVLRCQGGDAEALEILVERWHPRLLGFAIRVLGNRQEAEDALQSSWVEAVKRIGSLNDPKSIRPWMFRIVANKCTDLVRAHSKRRKVESNVDVEKAQPAITSETEKATDPSEQVRTLRRTMECLDTKHRDVLQLHYLECLSVVEIAEKLSIPAGTVKSRLHYAKQKLKRSIRGESDE